MKKQDDDDAILLTFSDIVAILRDNSKKLLAWSLAFALLAMLYALTKPIQYEAEGTFKGTGKTQSNLNNYLSATMMLLNELSQESDILSTMHSRKLFEQLVKDQALQATVIKSELSFPFLPIDTIKKNIVAELAIMTNKKFPALEDTFSDIHVTNLSYDEEVPSVVEIRILSGKDFQAKDARKGFISQGTFGVPFNAPGYSFVIEKVALGDLSGNEYKLHLMPLISAANTLLKQFTLQMDKDDATLIKITHRHDDRYQASENVNALMRLYQKHIQEEHCKLCDLQTAYLIKRQKEMAAELEVIMHEHAKELTTDISATGFATTEKAMEFLAMNLQELKRKLFTINIDLQRLENAQLDPTFDGELFSSTDELGVFKKISAERRQLKQIYDSLNLAVRGYDDNAAAFNRTFTKQLFDQEENKQLLADTKSMLASLEHNEVPQPHAKLMGNSKYVVKEWYEKFLAAKDKFDKHATDITVFEEWQQCKEGFSCYLESLNHYLSVNQKNIEQRLANQQGPDNSEYLGLNLNTINELYMNYSKELCGLESTVNEHRFVIDQIDKPDFEISSLSAILTDSVSTDMINKASALILALKDQENRSVKEQDRLTAELAIQKKFLKTHLQQSESLIKLRQDVLRNKIREIQRANFSLVQEEQAIMESQLKDYLAAAIENLTQEQALLTQNFAEIRSELSTLPQKRTREQLIEHQMTINKTLVEEISKLVESKNVSNNLEQFQSAPLDVAYPPLHPKSPRLLLLTILGAIVGAFLGLTWVLAVSVIEGIEMSVERLQAAGLHVSGKISRQWRGGLDGDPLLDADLDTLRRVITFAISSFRVEGKGKALLLIEGKGVDYALPLSELMVRKGVRVVLVKVRLSEPKASEGVGVMQYLEGKASIKDIIHQGVVDVIDEGGVSRYANELLSSQRFSELITALKKDYEWVIIDSNASPDSAEAECLLNMFETAAVSIQGQKDEDLKNVITMARTGEHHITFVLA